MAASLALAFRLGDAQLAERLGVAKALIESLIPGCKFFDVRGDGRCGWYALELALNDLGFRAVFPSPGGYDDISWETIQTAALNAFDDQFIKELENISTFSIFRDGREISSMDPTAWKNDMIENRTWVRKLT